jgi:hypothetical protein
MNEFLAEMYGTREAIGAEGNDDVEKLAEAQLLDEALQAEGVNIDDLPGDTILKLAYQILGEDSHLVKAAMVEAGEEEEEEEEEGKDEDKEPMEEKVAQADFLGRVMAHSYVNELGEIEKNAAYPTGFGMLGSAVSKATGKAAKRVKNWTRIKGAPKGKGTYSGSAQAGKGYGGGRVMGEREGKIYEALFKGKAKARNLGKGGLAHLKEHKGKYLTGAGLAAAAGGGFAAGKVGKKKAASAIDMLAEKRAMEWAESVGLVENDENEKLAAAVDARAYEMLLEQGVDVDAIEASLQE